MSKISAIFDTGRRSMMNSQTAMQTTGHNIANKATEGFSRQRVEVKTAEPIGEGGLRIGMGTNVANVTRTNNSFLEKQIANEQSTLGYDQGKSDAMARVEQVYNEQVNKSLNNSLGEFFNSFRELSANPESLATKTQVKETAGALIENFKHVHDQLLDISFDIDSQLKTNVNDINEYAKQIGILNEKIAVVEAGGVSANDERDSRDLYLKKLGEKINIKWGESSNGQITVTAGNVGVLVAGSESKVLRAEESSENEAKGRREGSVAIFYLNGEHYTPTDLTTQLKGGTVGGLLETRDKVINGLLKDMDQMAYTLGSTVNAVHSRGFDSKNRPGEDFFAMPDTVKNAAASMQVSTKIQNDVHRIATAAQAMAPGDNRVANAIAQIQYTGLMAGGGSTIDEYYNSVVSKVGIETRKVNMAADQQKDIVKQLSNIRESLSGVSLDEETTKLIEYQKAFDASARLIKTADEMMDTILNLKHM